MNRTTIINHFIDKYGYKTYLEIGTQNNKNYNKVNVEVKVGVDPQPDAGATHVMTSNKFFSTNSDKFDIIFIDGLHHEQQVYKDIKNAIKFLNKGGTIVCHDMNPVSEEMQAVPRVVKQWTGDCWKAWVRLRSEIDCEMYVVDTDFGCGIIRKGDVNKLKLTEELTYNNLEKNRKEWLNLMSVDEFSNKLGIVKEYDIYEIVPYGVDGNYGAACNHFVSLIPNDKDWVVIRDTDCLSLTPSHINMIKRAIDNRPEAVELLTCYTNRVGQKEQVYDLSLFGDTNVVSHRKLALDLASKPLSFKRLKIPISGYVMIFRKETWKEVGGFKSGVLGVDTNFSNKIRKFGYKIAVIENLYYFHYYRALEGTSSKDHIK